MSSPAVGTRFPLFSAKEYKWGFSGALVMAPMLGPVDYVRQSVAYSSTGAEIAANTPVYEVI